MSDVNREKDVKMVSLGVYLMLAHQVEGAMQRWQPLIEQGADDEEIRERIGDELGIYGGQSMEDHYFVDGHGGANPKIEVQQMAKPQWRKVFLLQGSDLISVARNMFNIPPKGQMKLF